LRRREHPNQPRFPTFSCYRKLPRFANDAIKTLFADHLAAARDRFGFNLYAWVVMPNHVHLLLWSLLPDFPLAIVLRDFKRDFATAVIARWRELDAPILARLVAADGSTRFWQRGGGHDDNVESIDELAEIARYLHLNPVWRGLVATPEEWAWSSARWYAGDRTGPVMIDPLPARRPTGTRMIRLIDGGPSGARH
jgi:putative transposase